MRRLKYLPAVLLLLAACGTATREDAAVDAAAAGGQVLSKGSAWTANAPDLAAEKILGALGAGEVDLLGAFDPDTAVRDATTRKVLVGTVDGFAPGPHLFAETADDPWAVPTLVMKVNVVQMLKGTPSASGSLYVQLMGSRDAAAATAALPTGAVVALYLQAPPQADPAVRVNDPKAGRPSGEALWTADPQGFVAADGPSGGVILPDLGEVRPTGTFVSQLPTGSVPR
jgi:hypothetical protein